MGRGPEGRKRDSLWPSLPPPMARALGLMAVPGRTQRSHPAARLSGALQGEGVSARGHLNCG